MWLGQIAVGEWSHGARRGDLEGLSFTALALALSWGDRPIGRGPLVLILYSFSVVEADYGGSQLDLFFVVYVGMERL